MDYFVVRNVNGAGLDPHPCAAHIQSLVTHEPQIPQTLPPKHSIVTSVDQHLRPVRIPRMSCQGQHCGLQSLVFRARNLWFNIGASIIANTILGAAYDNYSIICPQALF